MFDKYDSHHHSKTEYVTKNIHEHKALTDESIRIYVELKEKAFNEVKNAISIQDNIVNIIAIERFESLGNTSSFCRQIEKHYMVDFMLNNNRHSCDITIGQNEYEKALSSSVGLDEIIYSIAVKKFSEKLAEYIFQRRTWHEVKEKGKVVFMHPWEIEGTKNKNEVHI
jgi:hypothetical protein